MRREDLVNKIQILLENRGYCGNGDDGEAVMGMIEQYMMPMPDKPRLEDCSSREAYWIAMDHFSDIKRRYNWDDECVDGERFKGVF